MQNNSLLSVSSLNHQIKSLLETTFNILSVEGEVSSATYHTSGHLYFSIKDQNSVLKCVMWRSDLSKIKFEIKRGMRIVINGSIGVYTPRGEYQLFAKEIHPFGEGDLSLAYKQLKEKLANKGYFDAKHKKSLPKFISKIALVTAQNSAGLSDMLKVIEKRWKLTEVFVIDTLVQGQNAPTDIASSLEFADTLGVDVLVFGRGGGSVEDLWAFNTEEVADAVFNLSTPCVSAVGHEIDVLISDFIADLRAPTPSASIEMIFPDSREILYALNELENRFNENIEQKLSTLKDNLNHTLVRLEDLSLAKKLKEKQNYIVHLKEEFKRAISYQLTQKLHTSAYMKERLLSANPKNHTKEGWAKVSVDKKIINLENIFINQTFILEDKNTKLEVICVDKSTF